MRTAFKVFGGVTGASLASLGAAYKFGDDGTQRSLTFWGNMFPVYLHYRFYQLIDRDLHIVDSDWADRQYEKLHDKYTDRVKHIVYSMRGFYLKNAQVMSTQDDFIPPAYMKWVKDTQDNVPSEFTGTGAREYVTKMLRQELNVEFDEVYKDWDDVPLGVASIGQVHKAVLRKTGEVVAVKLLVPGIEERFRSDIKTLKTFCELAMPQHASAFDEIEKQFLTGTVVYAVL
jgi:aarF domain-containing kinase